MHGKYTKEQKPTTKYSAYCTLLSTEDLHMQSNIKTLPCQRAVCTSSLCKYHRDREATNTHMNSCIRPQKLMNKRTINTNYSRSLEVNIKIKIQLGPHIHSKHTNPVCEDKLDVASTS